MPPTKQTAGATAAAFDVHGVSRDAIDLEEKDATERQTNYNKIIFLQIVRELRSLMSTCKTDSSCDSDTRKKALMLMLDLKKLNRHDKLQNRAIREQVTQARLRVDTLHLQLENLLYETTCMEKEINKCREFKSKVSDVELLPLEETPEAIRDEKDEHALVLARLGFELERRKQLADELKAAENAREQCFEKVEAEKAKLEKAHPKLKNVVDIVTSTRDAAFE